MILFPALTSLHLTCCRGSMLLADSAELAELCAEICVQSLQIGVYTDSFRDDAFEWCRSAALHAPSTAIADGGSSLLDG